MTWLTQAQIDRRKEKRRERRRVKRRRKRENVQRKREEVQPERSPPPPEPTPEAEPSPSPSFVHETEAPKVRSFAKAKTAGAEGKPKLRSWARAKVGEEAGEEKKTRRFRTYGKGNAPQSLDDIKAKYATLGKETKLMESKRKQSNLEAVRSREAGLTAEEKEKKRAELRAKLNAVKAGQ